MDNFVCSEGRPPDGGIPEVLMAEDEMESDTQVGIEEEGGQEAEERGHVDIETCDSTLLPNVITEHENTCNKPAEMEAEEEEEEEKEPLNYELAQGHRILAELMSDGNKSLNWPFMDPVDTEAMGLADYHERVKEPIWLKKMLMKYDERIYQSITEFARDFRLMLENCYRYNGPDHYVSKRGQKLETVFEQKLGLLSRELREKTSIAATSGRAIEHQIITGTRRRKVLTPHDSSDLLNKLRQEEKERERENRKLLVEERKKQQQAILQEFIDWEDNMLGPGGRDYLYSMWELPQIGHFLFLTADVMNTGEIMQWELERSFWIPRQSAVLQVVMTSLLSTPYQRTRLESKPPMPYSVWEDRLRTRVRHWYKIYNENNKDARKTHRKIGLEEMFFKVVGLTSPLERKKFHEITFYQRVWIVKSLCDWCLATQESVQEALEAQPLIEQRHYDLGTDGDGNSYIHFPQFCGQDLRVYRVAPIQMPKSDKPKVKTEEKPKSPKKRSGRSRKRKNVKQSRKAEPEAAASSHSERGGSSSDSGINESDVSDVEPPTPKTRRRGSPAIITSTTNTDSGGSRQASASNTPTKGRSSRTSAAARDWMPRDASLISELSGCRGSHSQRLTCAVGNNSGTDTPTTTATPSGSRESTPAPTAERSSRSSTPSLDTCSRASSPSKQPTSSQSSTTGSNRRRRRAPQKREKLAGNISAETGDKTSMEIDTNSVGDSSSNADGKQTPPLGVLTGDLSASATSQVIGMNHNNSGKLNGESQQTESPDLKPLSSYDAGDSTAVTDNDKTRVSDIKDNCDKDSENQDPQQQQQQQQQPCTDTNLPSEHNSSTADSVDDGQSMKTLSRGNSLKGSSFDGENSENQFCICKCEGLKEINPSGLKPTGDTMGMGDTMVSPPSTCRCGNSSNAKMVSDDAPLQTSIKPEPMDMDQPPQQSQTTDMPVVIKTEPMSDTPSDITSPQDGLPANIFAESEIKQEAGSSVDSAVVKQEPMTDVVSESDVNQEPTAAVNAEVQQAEAGGSSTVVKQENPEDTTETPVKQEPEVELEPEIKVPEVGSFRLVADNVEMLRALTLEFAEPEPIIEIKGKKEKILRPPPRKRCVSELHARLVYLLKELEMWEGKLVAVNKKARLKIRKEVESFVEEPEPEVFEDVWESEESQSEDSDDENDESDDDTPEIIEQPVIEIKKDTRRTPSPSPVKMALKTKKSPIVTPDTDSKPVVESNIRTSTNDPEKSSYGRVRKRKVIPNAYDEPVIVSKKTKKGIKEMEPSPSPAPNILASSRMKKPGGAEPGGIDSLRTALSKAKPVSTPAALPPGMQLLNIGGQNVLLNTNTNPPVILQTSAPLNINNLTLLAQLSAKAAAGNTLARKIVVSSSPTKASATVTTSITTQAMSAPLTVSTSRSGQPQQQVIQTLLASSVQLPKPRMVAPSQPKQAVVSTVQQHIVTTPLVSAVTAATSPTQISSPSPLHLPPQSAVVSSDSNAPRPQFYKYNDMSQMKATIRQQLVKTSQGLRTKSTVCTVPSGNTALSNLIQAGLLPQQPTVLSSSTSASITVSSPQQLTTSPAAATTTVLTTGSPIASPETLAKGLPEPILMTTSPPPVQTPEVKPASILSQVLASSGPAASQSIAVHPMPTDIATTPVKQEVGCTSTVTVPLSVTPTKQQQLPTIQLQQQNTEQPQKQEQQVQVQLLPQQLQMLQQQPQQTPQQQQQVQHIVIGSPTGLQSPNSRMSPVAVSPTATASSVAVSPQKSPNSTTQQILPKGQLSPEFKTALKMGIVNESSLGSLIHKNPGFVKALNSTIRPKYASNVTVKSLLESRALRQKAQLFAADAEMPVIQQQATTTPPSNMLTLSPQKPAAAATAAATAAGATPPVSASPVKAQQLNMGQNPQVMQTVASPSTSLSAPSVVAAARPQIQTAHKAKTVVPGVQTQLVNATGTVVSSTLPKQGQPQPIQLQAVKTSTGTILRTLTGQVAVRPGGARLQLAATHGGQQMVRLVAPTSTGGTIQLADASLSKQPAVTSSIALGLPTAATKLDEAVKSVVTSVQCSIPSTPENIAAMPSATGQQQPIRQVTMTTNAMKSPIPSVTPVVSAPEPALPINAMTGNISTSTAQAAPKILLSNSTSPGVTLQGGVQPTATVVPSISGVGAQKNVVLRIVPGQQQVNAQSGVINMVLPQQLLQQSLKTDSATGKLVLQAGKGGIQLAQMAAATQGGSTVPASPIKSNIQVNMAAATTKPATQILSAAQQPLQAPTTTTPRTITILSPNVTASHSATQKSELTLTTNMQSPQPLIASSGDKSHVQIKLVPQSPAATISSVPQLTTQATILRAAQGAPAKPSQTLVIKKDGTVDMISQAPSSQPQPHVVSQQQHQQEQQQQKLVNQVNLQQQQQVLQKLTSPIKQVVGATQGSPSIRIVSPQLASAALSTAGLAHVQGSQVQGQSVAVQLGTAQKVEVQKQPTILLGGAGEATSSLDLLAAASMLKEAKAPLPTLTQQPTPPAVTQQSPATQLVTSTTNGQSIIHQAAKHSAGELLQAMASKQDAAGATGATVSGLMSLSLTKGATVEKQVLLQRQVLEEQQKQLLRQLTTRQQKPSVGGSTSVGVIPANVSVSSAGTSITSPVKPPPPQQPSAPKALSTTPIKTPPAKPVGATVATSQSSSQGVQMAGVMANAGGRMVQLRFAIPQGMSVQQVLQTPQFQQQLATLKVSAIHGITTSTVVTTTTTNNTVQSTTAAATAPQQSTSLASSSVLNHTVNNQPPTTATTPKPAVVTTPTVASAKPASISTVSTTLATAASNSLSKPQVTAAVGGKTVSLAAGVTGTLLSGGQQAMGASNNKVTVLVNVNGQLVQAHGVPVGGGNIRVVTPPRLATAQAAAPRLVHPTTAVNNSKVITTTATPQQQPRLLAQTLSASNVNSPTKVVLQPQGISGLQRATGGQQQLQQLILTRGLNTSSSTPIRLPVGMTLQSAAKSQLLTQLATVVTGTPPGGLVVTKPILAPNTSNPQAAQTAVSTVTSPQEPTNLQNGK